MSAETLTLEAMQEAYNSVSWGYDAPGLMIFPATKENLWRFCPWVMLRRSREMKRGKYRRFLA